ncbi:MutS protein msh4 [Leucoagaricus gongylophorus]
MLVPDPLLQGGIAAVNARVYAVRANRNKLLDVARETYKENVGDIYQLNKTLADEHALPLTLMYQDSGFVFVLKKTTLDGELPRGFINVSSRRGKWLFSSIELRKLNARMKDALDEALILSEKIIQGLVVEIVADIGALYKASEAVALVDMLWSFSHASISQSDLVDNETEHDLASFSAIIRYFCSAWAATDFESKQCDLNLRGLWPSSQDVTRSWRPCRLQGLWCPMTFIATMHPHFRLSRVLTCRARARTSDKSVY